MVFLMVLIFAEISYRPMTMVQTSASGCVYPSDKVIRQEPRYISSSFIYLSYSFYIKLKYIFLKVMISSSQIKLVLKYFLNWKNIWKS